MAWTLGHHICLAAVHPLCLGAHPDFWDPQRPEEEDRGADVRLLEAKLGRDQVGEAHVQLHLQEAAGVEEETEEIQKCHPLHVSLSCTLKQRQD